MFYTLHETTFKPVYGFLGFGISSNDYCIILGVKIYIFFHIITKSASLSKNFARFLKSTTKINIGLIEYAYEFICV